MVKNDTFVYYLNRGNSTASMADFEFHRMFGT